MTGAKSPLEVYCETMQKLCAFRLSKDYDELFNVDSENSVLFAINDEIKRTAEDIIKAYDELKELRSNF